MLVRRLRELGEDWSDPQISTGPGVDAEASWNDRMLSVQVTKAQPDTDFWKAVRQRREAETSITVDDAADLLRGAIRGKSLADVAGVTLALNAMQAPALGMPKVVASFRERHGDWAGGLGFDSIWVVGPHESFTHRLDTVSG